MMVSLHPLDYAVLAAYVLIVLVVCARTVRRAPDADELFLAGRSLGAGVVGLSLFASNISSTTLIGLPGAAWEHGISVANYEWMAALVLIFSLWFVVPVFIGRRLTTVPELLEQRFDRGMRRYLSGVTVFLALVLDTAGSLYAGALVLTLFFPGLALAPTCAAIALFAGLYTAAGGLRAVAYTDVVQSLVLLLGSAMLFVLVWGQFDYSWEAVRTAVEPEKLSLIRPADDPSLPWTGTLLGLPILGFYYWTMNQYVSQRLLGARDLTAAARGSLLAAALKLLPVFLMVLPGVMAIPLLGGLERADLVFPTLIARYAPIGIAGLILAGLLAAIMSSIDSALNSASTLITVDFVRPRRPGMDTQAMARLGRLLTMVLVALAALWAPMIDRFQGLFAYLQQTFAYVTPPLVAVFVLALFSRRIGAAAALRATLTGHAVSLVAFVAAQWGWLPLHFTVVAAVLFAVTIGAAHLWQFAAGADRPDAARLASVDRRSVPRLSQGQRALALALVALTAAIVFALR